MESPTHQQEQVLQVSAKPAQIYSLTYEEEKAGTETNTDPPIKNNKKPKQETQEHSIFTKMQGKINHQIFGNFWPTCLMLSWQDHSMKMIPGCFFKQ